MKDYIKNKLGPKIGELLGLQRINNEVLLAQYNIKRYLLEQNILYSHEMGITKEKYAEHDIIVSLTTFGNRINDVHLTIESLMEQTFKPNKIILWLDYIFEKVNLPQALVLLQKRGLDIAYCKDVRSYTKLVPALREYPEDAIITVDDDVIYEYDMLEHLILPYLDDKSYIYCHRYHNMTYDENGKLKPYNLWDMCGTEMKSDINMFPTGVGGVLYPPHSLSDEVVDESVFLDICKYADDVWFKAMALKKGTLPKRVYSHNAEGYEYMANPAVHDGGLASVNVLGESLNDAQIKAVFGKYNLYTLLNID